LQIKVRSTTPQRLKYAAFNPPLRIAGLLLATVGVNVR
jgi:hypothetical protein